MDINNYFFNIDLNALSIIDDGNLSIVNKLKHSSFVVLNLKNCFDEYHEIISLYLKSKNIMESLFKTIEVGYIFNFN